MAVKEVRPDLDTPGERKLAWLLLLVPLAIFVFWIIEQMIMSP